MTVQVILDDLIAEQQALDDVVGRLSEEQWATATPSPGWTIADQIAHLTYFDATAALAIRDTAAFIEHRAHLVELMADPDATEAETMGPLRALTGDGLLSEWRANRRALEAAGRGLAEDAAHQVPWARTRGGECLHPAVLACRRRARPPCATRRASVVAHAA